MIEDHFAKSAGAYAGGKIAQAAPPPQVQVDVKGGYFCPVSQQLHLQDIDLNDSEINTLRRQNLEPLVKTAIYIRRYCQ